MLPKQILYILFALSSLALLSSCGLPDSGTSDSERPQITDVTLSPEIVQPSQKVNITVKATDAQGDALVYTWSAQNGSLTSGPTPSSSNIYTAPDFVVDDIITVVVTDAKGNVAKERRYVRIVTANQVTAVTQGTPLPTLPPLTEPTKAVPQSTIAPGVQPTTGAGGIITPVPISSGDKKGVLLQLLASNLVDRDTGFSMTTVSSTTEKENGELEVIIRTPDGKPYVGTYVAILKQKLDVNNQPIPGDRVAEFRTNDTGRGTVVLPPGTYGVWPTEVTGLPWTGLNFYKQVEARKKTTITIVPSRLIVVIRRADSSLITNSYVSVSTQKTDANGKPLYNQKVREGRTYDTGEISFDLSPGTYALYFEAARGEDWGVFNNYLPPASQLVYNMTLGRIRIESRDASGNVISGFYSRVVFRKKDANGKTIPGDLISEGRTDDTGVFQHDLTPGTYIIQSDAGVKNEMTVRSGETITIKNTEFEKP